MRARTRQAWSSATACPSTSPRTTSACPRTRSARRPTPLRPKAPRSSRGDRPCRRPSTSTSSAGPATSPRIRAGTGSTASSRRVASPWVPSRMTRSAAASPRRSPRRRWKRPMPPRSNRGARRLHQRPSSTLPGGARTSARLSPEEMPPATLRPSPRWNNRRRHRSCPRPRPRRPPHRLSRRRRRKRRRPLTRHRPRLHHRHARASTRYRPSPGPRRPWSTRRRSPHHGPRRPARCRARARPSRDGVRHSPPCPPSCSARPRMRRALQFLRAASFRPPTRPPTAASRPPAR